MTITAALARDDTITEALRAANDAIGDEEPTQQAMLIFAALKRLRSPVRVQGSARIDYLEKVQRAAQSAWNKTHAVQDRIVLATPPHGPEFDAVAGVDTPIGRLKAVTFRKRWSTGRLAWSTEYYLNDAPITIAEIRQAGLAQRPTTRNRQKGKRK